MKNKIILIIVGIVLFLLSPALFILFIDLYITYRMFKGVILWNEANNMTKVTRNIAITAITCFPVAIVEMFYIYITKKREETE